ncbi:hypothetical protein Acr_00g0014840 [Actinidia rufa]|uniref:Uncharacterized protein n=1 Tax=Actinidia rufa TaxID=165716 RepID=A0A7J0DAF3_9ERIC|nr:hypothetical protein Acr_00g0014840 [Actinidia rufa]
MPTRNARGRAKSLTGARGVCGTHWARRNLNEGDDHQESVMRGRASAPVGNVGNVGGAPPAVFGGVEFMQGVFTAIEQVGEPDPLMAKDWLEQVTRALDTILVTDEELRVLFASYQFAAVAIEETLNETRKITNPKSQCEGTSNQSEGHFFKKPKSSTTQQQYPVKSSPNMSVVSSDQTSQKGPTYFGYHQYGRVIDCPLKGQLSWTYHASVQAEGEQSGSYRIAITYLVSSGIEGHSNIYLSTDFILVQTTGYSSAGSENAGTCLCYDISSGTVGDNWTTRVVVGYLCCARYFTYV